MTNESTSKHNCIFIRSFFRNLFAIIPRAKVYKLIFFNVEPIPLSMNVYSFTDQKIRFVYIGVVWAMFLIPLWSYSNQWTLSWHQYIKCDVNKFEKFSSCRIDNVYLDVLSVLCWLKHIWMHFVMLEFILNRYQLFFIALHTSFTLKLILSLHDVESVL